MVVIVRNSKHFLFTGICKYASLKSIFEKSFLLLSFVKNFIQARKRIMVTFQLIIEFSGGIHTDTNFFCFLLHIDYWGDPFAIFHFQETPILSSLSNSLLIWLNEVKGMFLFVLKTAVTFSCNSNLANILLHLPRPLEKTSRNFAFHSFFKMPVSLVRLNFFYRMTLLAYHRTWIFPSSFH